MAEGITLKRIIDMDEAAELTSSDYALVDSATGGPKKFALGDELSSLKDDFSDLATVATSDGKFSSSVEYGAINGGQEATNTSRARTVDYLPIFGGNVILTLSSGYSAHIVGYDSNKEYVSDVSGWVTNGATITATGYSYIRLVFKNSAGSTLTDSDITTLSGFYITETPLMYEELKSNLIETDHFEQWQKGTYNANGTISASGNGAVSSITPFFEADIIRCELGSRFILAFYSDLDSYIGKVGADGSINTTSGDWKYFTTDTVVSDYAPSNAKKYLICLLPTDGTTITTSNVATWANNHSSIIRNILQNTLDDLEAIKDQLTGDISDAMHSLFDVHMTHNGNGTYGASLTRNAIITPQHFLTDVNIACPSNRRFAYQLYDGFETGPTHLTYASGWLKSAIIPAGSYWCMIVANDPDADTDATTQDSLTFSVAMTANDVYYRFLTGDDVLASYVIGADSIKRGVTVQGIGTLTYGQSFCMYDNKYYSTDGSNIGVQDSSFNAVSTKALTVGHGNAFQLGNNGKAYISGWNDQKVYVVDMETLEIDSEINLGTSGYTTAVIDDLNHIAYIFQRDSYPDTVVNYNFIVYDYQAQQVKSTRVINAFSAMQAADYYNGRIAVLWGMGTAASPSGMAIYNTNGDILAEYTIDVFANREPEGIFFNRKNGEIIVSTVAKVVYKIK